MIDRELLFKKFRWLIRRYSTRASASISNIEKKDMFQIFSEGFSRVCDYVDSNEARREKLFSNNYKGFYYYLDSSLNKLYSDLLNTRDTGDLVKWGATKSSMAHPRKIKDRWNPIRKCTHFKGTGELCGIDSNEICSFTKDNANSCNKWREQEISRTIEVPLLNDNLPGTQDIEFEVFIREFMSKKCSDVERKYINIILNDGYGVKDKEIIEELGINKTQLEEVKDSLKLKLGDLLF